MTSSTPTLTRALPLVAALLLGVPLPGAADEPATFTVISDSHVCPPTMLVGGKCYPDTRKDLERRFAAAGKAARFYNGDFVVSLGDNIEDLWLTTGSDSVNHYVNLVEKYFGGVRSYWSILGNHDIRTSWPKVPRLLKDDPFSGESYFKVSLRKDTALRYFDRASEEADWIHFARFDTWTIPGKPWLFVALNSGEDADSVKDASNVAFGEPQLDALTRVLKGAQERSAVLFWHVNPRKEINGVGGVPRGRDGYLDVLCARREKIKAIFVGHTHASDRFSWDCGDEGEPIRFYVAGSTGKPRTGDADLWMNVRLTDDDVVIVNEAKIAWKNRVAFEEENRKVRGERSHGGPQLATLDGKLYMSYLAASGKKGKYEVLVAEGKPGAGGWQNNVKVRQKSTDAGSIIPFKGKLFVAFKAASSENLLISANSGSGWPKKAVVTGAKSRGGPSLVVHENQLKMFFNSGGRLASAASSDGSRWAVRSASRMELIGVPAAAVFQEQVYLAYRSAGDWLNIAVGTGTDGRWTSRRLRATMSESPALAVFEDRLYVAFRARSSGELLFGSSADGVKWSVFEEVKQRSSRAPALAALGEQLVLGFKAASSDRLLTVATKPKSEINVRRLESAMEGSY